jgi:hypothetical protein
VRAVVNGVLDAGGALAARKVFTRRDVVVAVAPSPLWPVAQGS